MDTMDIVSIISIILTCIFGVAGIYVSWYCWSHNYKEIKFLQRLNAWNLNCEYSFQELTKIIKEADEQNIDISAYFNLQDKSDNDNKISKNQIMTIIYNMYHNTKQ